LTPGFSTLIGTFVHASFLSSLARTIAIRKCTPIPTRQRHSHTSPSHLYAHCHSQSPPQRRQVLLAGELNP
jgi:hypothetical protein